MAETLEVKVVLKDEASKAMADIGGIGKGIMAVGLGAAAAGAAGLAAGLGLAISEAMDAQTVQAQLNAVLKSTGEAAGLSAEEANSLAESLSGVTRYSDDAIVSGESMLLTFTNIGKDVFPMATEVMLDMSTAMGTDLKGSAIQLGKALNDPAKGMTALTKVGVTFTDEQKKMIEELQASGDIMGAQKVILAELSKEFGGSAKAAGETFSGQLDILKNSLLNVAEGVGMQLLPMLQDLVTNVLLPAVPSIQAFAQGVADLVIRFIEWLNTLRPVVDFLQANWQPIVAGLVALIIGLVIPAFIAWATAAWASAVATITALAPVILPIMAIAAAIGLLVAAWQNDWGGIRTTITTFWEETGKPIFDALVGWLKVNIPAAIEVLKGFWEETLLPAIQAVWAFIQDNVFPIFTTLGEWLQTTIPAAIEVLKGWWDKLVTAVTTVYDFFAKNLIPILTDLGTQIGTTLGGIIKTFMDLLTGKTSLWEAINKIYKIVMDSVNPILEDLGDLFETILPGPIKDFINNVLDKLKNGFSGLKGIIDGIIKAVTDFIQALIDAAGKIPDIFKGKSPSPLEKSFRGIGDAIRDLGTLSLPGLQTKLTLGGVDNEGIGGTNYTYSPTIYVSNQPDFAQEFMLMKSLSRA